MNAKLKHLEFIQNTISRMGGNLFILKGWAVTLVIALFTFIAKENNGVFILFAFVILITFWIIDGFYLSRERCYRALYDSVRVKKEKDIDFEMKYEKFYSKKNTWISSIFSQTLLIFYGSLAIATIIIVQILNLQLIEIIIKIN